MFDKLRGLHARVEALHAESQAPSEPLPCIDAQIEQQMPLRQSGSPTEPQTPDSADEDADPPFHLVGA
jgi:hypothetical protein